MFFLLSNFDWLESQSMKLLVHRALRHTQFVALSFDYIYSRSKDNFGSPSFLQHSLMSYKIKQSSESPKKKNLRRKWKNTIFAILEKMSYWCPFRCFLMHFAPKETSSYCMTCQNVHDNLLPYLRHIASSLFILPIWSQTRPRSVLVMHEEDIGQKFSGHLLYPWPPILKRGEPLSHDPPSCVQACQTQHFVGSGC